MDLFLEILGFSLENLLDTLKSPLFLLVLGLIFIQYRKIGKLERQILGLNTSSIIYNLIVSTGFGLLGGLLASIVFLGLGTAINPEDFYYILPLAIFLSLINPRFICFSYAGGIIALISLVFGVFKVNIPGILMVVGVLHLVESLLILLDGKTMRIPIFMERDRQIVGGFMLNRFWPLPFTVFVNGPSVYPITIIAILGYGDYALTSMPGKKARETAASLFIYSLTLLILANMSQNYRVFQYLGAIFSILGHETVIYLGGKKERLGSYIFKPSPYGLKILDVLPNSIGQAMGLASGDIITSLNGERIYSERDIEEILIYKPTYIWLEAFTMDKKMVTRDFQDYRKGIRRLGLLTLGPGSGYNYVIREGASVLERLIRRLKKNRARFKN